MLQPIHDKEECRARLELNKQGHLYAFACYEDHTSIPIRVEVATEFMSAEDAMKLLDDYLGNGKCEFMIDKCR